MSSRFGRVFGRVEPEAPLALGNLRAAVPTLDGVPEDFAGLDGPAFLRLARAVDCPPPLPMLTTDPAICPPHVLGWHSDAAGRSCDIGVFRLDDALYDGRGLIRDDHGTVLTAPETTAAYWQAGLDAGAVEPLQPGVQEVRLDMPAIACMTPGLRAYGHWLLEILPRLWLARRVLGPAFASHAILIDEDAPVWADDMMAAVAGVQSRQIMRYRRAQTLLRVPRLVVPGLLHGNFHFHPYAAQFFDSLAGEDSDDFPAVFQIPRPNTATDPNEANRRICVNASVMEAHLIRCGIPVVRPETMSLGAQAALFRKARLVIGEFGSALHNGIFSSADTRIISLGFINHVQSSIAAFRQQRLIYVASSHAEDIDGVSHVTFEMDMIEMALDVARRSMPKS